MLLVYLERRRYPLFSSKFLIGQLYSNWPGLSSRTVMCDFNSSETRQANFNLSFIKQINGMYNVVLEKDGILSIPLSSLCRLVKLQN